MNDHARAAGRVEVRPSWSAAEWIQVTRAASSVLTPPSAWAGDVLGGVLGIGQGPSRCTGRVHLWQLLLERWQSVFWACVALRSEVPADRWDAVADTVGRAGILIGEQADQVAAIERRRASEVMAAVTGMIAILGPKARRRASASRPDPALPRVEGHRAKLLLAPQTHEALAQAAREGGWTVSDYAGAATAASAALMLLDSGAATEGAVLQRCHDHVQAIAARLADQLAAGRPLTRDLWDAVASDLASAEELLRQAHGARGGADGIVDVRAAFPGVFLTLGWVVRWAVKWP